MNTGVVLDERSRSLLDVLTALFSCRLRENEGRRVGSYLKPCCPFSATATRVALLQWL
jgi:hypothetical protein